MSASKVQICNVALGVYLGKGRINSLSEGTAASLQCTMHYDDTRQELLSEWPWSFATQRETLAKLSTNDRDEWASKFATPSNMLRLNWVNDPAAAKQGIFEREIYDTPRDMSAGYIYSDLTSATAEYIEDTDDPTFYPPKFSQAFSALLASKMAIPLTETASKYQAAVQAYSTLLEQAKIADYELEPPIVVRKTTDYTAVR